MIEMNQEQNYFNTQGNNEIYNNQNLNSKPPKKVNLVVIIGIIIIIIIIILVVALFILKDNNNSSTEGIFGSSGSITTEKISEYGLENDTIWINKALGITYNIPKRISNSVLNGTGSFNYIHGSMFEYYNNYYIYVDKSLEGNTNLETLASDIVGEKISDKYKFVYGFGSTLTTQFKNSKTEKVKVGQVDTVYFESEDINSKSISGKDLTIKVIGYSFKYNNEYISVYGEVLMEENNKMEDLKQRLQYIINSIKEYKGESFQELGGNAKNYYDTGYTSTYHSNDSKKHFTINLLSSHVANGVLRSHGKPYDVVMVIDANKVNWDGTLDGIFEATQNQKFEYNKYAQENYPTYMTDFPWVSYDSTTWKNEYSIEILKEEKINVSNTDMKKYLIKTRLGDSVGEYIVVYTFMFNDEPWIASYSLDTSAYKSVGWITNMTKEQSDIAINQTEMVADSSILTFRVLEPGEDELKYMKP